MTVLIKNLKYLISDLHWCYCKKIYTQDHTVAVITHNESADVFSWKGDSLKEYWYFILNAFIWSENGSKVRRPDLIVYYGCSMALLIHEGNKAE